MYLVWCVVCAAQVPESKCAYFGKACDDCKAKIAEGWKPLHLSAEKLAYAMREES